MSDQNSKIRYVGPPTMTESGRDVVAFHLHRYLAPWMAAFSIEKVWIVVGFERSHAQAQTFVVTPREAAAVRPHWEFDDVVQTWRHGNGRLNLEVAGSDSMLAVEAVPLLDSAFSDAKSKVLLGFALMPESGHVSQDTIGQLQSHAGEAIQAARRNAIRLLFDETERNDIKPFLYEILDHLPEWTAVDGSAAIILSNSLDAMNLDAPGDAEFHVMAERLFHDDEDSAHDRLVGMWLHADERSFLGAAVNAQRKTTRMVVHRFDRGDTGRWSGANEEFGAFHVATRQEEQVYMVPLLTRDETDAELLGFVLLAYRGPAANMAASTIETLTVLSSRLARFLRHSPLYTLSARKMWILGQIRKICEREVAADSPPAERFSRVVDDVTSLVNQHADVPAFALGSLIRGESGRKLVYETSFGWTDFDSIELPVDVDPGSRSDSGVSSLSVRLGRPIVLSGKRNVKGHHDFKNYLWVDETTGRLVDARSPEGANDLEGQGDWVRLSNYYKPARANAYASIAVPIEFAGKIQGVVAVEVDRDTQWYWWSGYGGLLFWEMMAADLAFAFRTLLNP